MDYPVLSRKKMKEKPLMMKGDSSVGAELHYLDAAKSVMSDPVENNKRRTLKLTKRSNSWGFTLQTYGIKHKKTNEIEIMTYVDYVVFGGAAWIAGMRSGDVMLSVNGDKVGEVTHQQLVNKIKQAGDVLRIVVLFEDCCKKVELHERFLKLKAVLVAKQQELKELELKEMQILDNYCRSKGLNRFEQVRQSIKSTTSSSDSWDAYSMISSPNGMLPTGNYNRSKWSSITSLKSYSMGDNSSIYEDDYGYIDSETDSDGISVTFGNHDKTHSSDSYLVMKHGATDPRRVKAAANIRMSRSSDSTLYRKSRSPLRGQRLFKDKLQIESEESINDEVFNTEDDNLRNSKDGFRIEDDDIKLQEQKVSYSGENGNIIVPKICIEGEEIYTTFDEIPTKVRGNCVPNIDPLSYKNNIVAMEIAQDMANCDQLAAEYPNTLVVQQQTVEKQQQMVAEQQKMTAEGQNQITEVQEIDMSNRSLDHKPGNEKETKNVNQSSKLNEKLDKFDTGANAALQNGQSNGAKLKYSKSRSPNIGSTRTQFAETRSVKSSSPKGHRDFISGIGCSLSYEQLKSSVPDIRLSFHTEECEVIYINEKNETTKL